MALAELHRPVKVSTVPNYTDLKVKVSTVPNYTDQLK